MVMDFSVYINLSLCNLQKPLVFENFPNFPAQDKNIRKFPSRISWSTLKPNVPATGVGRQQPVIHYSYSATCESSGELRRKCVLSGEQEKLINARWLM